MRATDQALFSNAQVSAVVRYPCSTERPVRFEMLRAASSTPWQIAATGFSASKKPATMALQNVAFEIFAHAPRAVPAGQQQPIVRRRHRPHPSAAARRNSDRRSSRHRPRARRDWPASEARSAADCATAESRPRDRGPAPSASCRRPARAARRAWRSRRHAARSSAPASSPRLRSDRNPAPAEGRERAPSQPGLTPSAPSIPWSCARRDRHAPSPRPSADRSGAPRS